MSGPPPRPSTSPSLLAVLVTAGVLAAVSLAVSFIVGPPTANATELVLAGVLAAAAVAADLRPVTTGPQQKTSLATIPAVIAALLLPPFSAAASMVVAAAISNLMLRRTARNVLFNASLVGAGVGAAGLVGRLQIEPTWPGVLRAVLAPVVLAMVTIAGAAAASAANRRARIATAIANAFRDSWPEAAAMGSIGVTASLLWISDVRIGALIPFAAVPLLYRLHRVIRLEAASKMSLDRTLRAQRQFATDVFHNVASPLTTIRMNLSILAGGPLRHNQLQAHRNATTEAARLSDLLQRLRVLAETDEDVPLRNAPLEPAELTADVAQAFALTASARQVSLRIEQTDAVLINADRDLLRQAVACLVDNAIRHSPQAGTVTLRTVRSGRDVRVEVEDSGPGIEPERLPQIFERFARGPSGGSGLGLAIARSIVERHAGRIEVTSAPGSGALFSIVLPRT